ncbi:MAG: hypothetical protein ACSW8J_01235, partial [bacterium]
RFTPTETDWYEFASSGSDDTFGYIYDGNMQMLASDDDGGANRNFKVVAQLTAGTTYYLGARYYSAGTTGTFSVTIARNNHLTAGREGSRELRLDIDEKATLRVAASCARGSIHYEWHSMPTGSGTYARIDGARAASLTIDALQCDTQYRCRVTDDYDNAVDVDFSVILENHLTVWHGGSARVEVAPGASATLAVDASCDFGDVHYQWYRRTYSADGGYEDAIIDGATGATCDTGAINWRAAFICEVWDDYRHSRKLLYEVSVGNRLSVKNAGKSELFVLPGESVTLRVNAACATGELHYNWTDSNYETPAGANGASCAVENIMRPQRFECRVLDDYGNSGTVYFSIRVDNGFGIDNPFNTIVIPWGESARLETLAYSDSAAINYSWSRSYRDDTGYLVFEDIDDADAAVLVTEAITGNATYYCDVQDEYGNSSQARFDISVDNALTVEPVGSATILRKAGEPVKLTIRASCANGDLTYKWWADYYDPIARDWDFQSYATNEPTFTLNERQAYGDFECEVSDAFGNSVELRFQVRMESDFTASAAIGPVVKLSSGRSVTLRVNARSNYELDYQWYREDELIDGATTYFYKTAPLTETTDYYCRVRDALGESETVHFLCLVDAEALEANRDTEITARAGEYRYFVFTPTETDTYTLESIGALDPVARLYGSDCEELAYDDDGGRNNNFFLTAPLTAGAQYIIRVHLYEDEDTSVGSFSMRLSQGLRIDPDMDEDQQWFLRAGQTVIGPGNVFSIESSDPSALSASGNQITALKAGDVVVRVTYAEDGDDYSRIFIATIFDGDALTLPAALRVVGEEAFIGDTALQMVELGEQVERVERNAFSGTGLVQVVVNSASTTFGGGSLRGTENPTILCKPDSRAENYAISNDLNYLYLP